MIEDYSKSNNFLQNSILGTSELLRLNRFIGVLDVPTTLKNKTMDSQKLTWNLFQVNCPALRLGIETKEVDMFPRYYIKNWEYDDLSVSFIESSDMVIKKFFYDWMSSLGLNANTYSREYFGNIASSSFTISPLNNNNDVSTTHQFLEVMPFSIDSHDFNMSSEDNDLVMTTIKFKYVKHLLV